MGVLVVGGGLAGLTAAIKARRAAPWLDVVLVDKPRPVSNTQISGMRLRAGISNRRIDAEAEILELLAQRNAGAATPAMREFARLAARELQAWQRHAGFAAQDRREWFGPQWGRANQAGKGHGKSVLDWLRRVAADAGVRTMTAEAERLELSDDRIESVLLRDGEGHMLRMDADVVILAAGSAGGTLFLSTNRLIGRSAHELAYEAGLPLTDSTLHMIHPFGNVARDGAPGLGCYETDTLAGVDVFAGARIGHEFHHRTSSELLAGHQAHYHFPELVRAFSMFGDLVRLRLPNGRDRFARVSHHYHHLGIETNDGVQVPGIQGLFAVGDASGIGYWTNHHERFPGFALLKCLVDAALVVERALPLASSASVQEQACGPLPPSGDRTEPNRDLRALNSRMLARLLSGSARQRRAVAGEWIDSVRRLGDDRGWTTSAELSLAMAWAHQQLLDSGQREPIRIDTDLVDRLRGRHLHRATGPGSTLQAKVSAGVDSSIVSDAQEHIWFLERLHGATPLHTSPLALRLRGRLDRDALECSLAEVVQRHEMLRTTIAEADGRPRPAIEEAPWTAYHVLDARDAPAGDRWPLALALATEFVREPLSLSAGPLLRAALIEVDVDDALLVVAIHRVAIDDRSLDVIRQELGELYSATVEGRPTDLADPKNHYAEHIRRRRDLLEAGKLDDELAWWRERMHDAPEPVELPIAHRRPPVQSFRGDVVDLELGDDLRRRVHAAATRWGTTSFAVLTAAFAVVLGRYTSEHEVVLGTTDARPPESGQVVGPFANTFALRLSVSPEESFRAAVDSVARRLADASDYGRIPFERLVEALGPSRTRSHAPLFQTMVRPLRNSTVPRMGALTAEPVELHTGTAMFDMTLSFEDDGATLRATLEYATDLFVRPAAQRVLGHLRTLLHAAIEDPEASLGDLPIVGADERRELLSRSRSARTSQPQSFLDLIDRTIIATPTAPAVEGERGTLSYAELGHLADAVAGRLRVAGVRHEDRVALALERSPEAIAALLGIMRAGAAYVPLDPSYPMDRLAFMLADSAVAAVVADDATLARLPAPGVPIVHVEAGIEAMRGETETPLPPDIAYVVYTSGSTGAPKGVAMTHGCLNGLIEWQLRRFSGPARTSQFSALSFDVGFQEIAATLASGGTLVVVPERLRRDTTELASFLRKRNVTRMFLPFVALDALAEAIAASDEATTLREVVTAGEQLRITPAIATLFKSIQGGYLENQYGPSETHVVTAYRLAGPVDEWSTLPPIGRQIDGASVYVLDERLEPVALGLPGDIYVGGAALARGYLGRSTLTAERFGPDPYAVEPGGRLYRTGDVGRLREDGSIDFLGRNDDQVKVRGFRVELGEVEAALAEHPVVRTAAAAAPEVVPGERRLVGYVVPMPGAAPADAELDAWLRDKLPEPLVPSAIVFLDSLPLTPTGKVDRGALPLPEARKPAAGDRLAAPATATERKLAEVWAELLGVDRVGRDDDFFELGGHSLLATRLVSRIRRDCGAELPLQDVFTART